MRLKRVCQAPMPPARPADSHNRGGLATLLSGIILSLFAAQTMPGWCETELPQPREQLLQEAGCPSRQSLPPFALPSNSEKQSPASRTQAIDALKLALAGTQRISCTLREQFSSPQNMGEEKAAQILIVLPDKRKKISLHQGEFDRVEIEDANVSWHIANPKSVSKVVWEHSTHFIPSPIPDSPLERTLQSFDYYGIAEFQKTRCHLFSSQGFDYYLGVEDGILRKKVQKPWPSESTQTVFTQVFFDIRGNIPISDNEFEVIPGQGCEVSETVYGAGQEKTERSYIIEYHPPAAAATEAQTNEQHLSRMRERFRLINNFICKYKITETSNYHKIGPAPGSANASDTWKTPVTVQEGMLIVEKPSKVSFRFNEVSNVYKPKPNRLFLCDGESTWSIMDMGGHRSASESRVVVKERIAAQSRFV